MADEDYANGDFTQDTGEGFENYGNTAYNADGGAGNGTGETTGEDGQGDSGDVHMKEMTSESKKESDDDRKLFVGGLSWETSQKDLKDYFSKFGDITEVNIKTDPNTGRSRGFAFIQFGAKDSVEQVLATGPHSVNNKQVDPKRAKARPGIKKIFVGGLDPELPEAEIRSYFEKYGKIEEIELPFDKQKNQRRQFCFITFEGEDVVEEICKMPKQKIGSKECDVKKATPKQDPRARGGWGGGGGGFYGFGGGRGGRGQHQNQGWGGGNYNYNPGYGGGYGYGQGYGGGYGNDYYGGYGGYGGGGGYDGYGNWGGYGGGAGGFGGQQPGGYGKSRRGGHGGYHPYSR